MATSASTRSNSVYENTNQDHMTAGESAWQYFREYARERPEVVVLWSFGIGFLLGWRLKPW